MPMLKLDPGPVRAIGDEPDLDLAGVLGVGLQLPGRSDVPAEHHPARRVVDQDPCPPALAAVLAAVDYVPAHPRLEGRRDDRRSEEVVLAGLDRIEPLSERRKSAFRRPGHHNLVTYHGGIGGLGHSSSFIRSSKPDMVRLQNVSSWSRSAATPASFSL